MLTKKAFINLVSIFILLAITLSCFGCNDPLPPKAENNIPAADSYLKDSTTDSNSSETTDSETKDEISDEPLSEAEIEKYTTYKTVYYYSTLGYRFEPNDTVPVDKVMELFILHEFSNDRGRINEEYSQYCKDISDPFGYHTIPVNIVNDWLEAHMDVQIDYNGSAYYNGNGCYNIALGGRGGPVGEVTNITKKSDGTVIIDVLGGGMDMLCYDYLQIAVKEYDNDYKFLYCRDNFPKTNLSPENAVETLKDALGYTKDTIYAIEHNYVTPFNVNDEIYCSINPYVTTGAPEGMPENTFYRTTTTPLYVSLETGRIFKAVSDTMSPLPTDFVEYNFSDIETSITAYDAIGIVRTNFTDNKTTTVVECELALFELNGNYYYTVYTYKFDENDPFYAYESGYISTVRTDYYVSVTDGKVYTLEYDSDSASFYMELHN